MGMPPPQKLKKKEKHFQFVWFLALVTPSVCSSPCPPPPPHYRPPPSSYSTPPPPCHIRCGGKHTPNFMVWEQLNIKPASGRHHHAETNLPPPYAIR